MIEDIEDIVDWYVNNKYFDDGSYSLEEYKSTIGKIFMIRLDIMHLTDRLREWESNLENRGI